MPFRLSEINTTSDLSGLCKVNFPIFGFRENVGVLTDSTAQIRHYIFVTENFSEPVGCHAVWYWTFRHIIAGSSASIASAKLWIDFWSIACNSAACPSAYSVPVQRWLSSQPPWSRWPHLCHPKNYNSPPFSFLLQIEIRMPRKSIYLRDSVIP